VPEVLVSRIALRFALATVFTTMIGVAAVYSGDSEQPKLRVAPAAGTPNEDARAPLKLVRELQPLQRRGGVTKTGRDTASAGSGALTGSVPIASIAEALQIRFQGFNELSGVYRINEDDTISVPGIGRFELGTMPAEQLENLLSKRILSLTGREGMVSIEVDRYRHVFVTGEVDKPGSFNWFRGMTVLKAMSMAGGFARQKEREQQAEDKSDMVALQLARALSRHARLAAEVSGRNTIDVPERLIGLCGQYRARELINTEEALLGMRRGSRLASIKAIDAGTSASAAEISRLKELQASLDTRYDRFNEHAQSLGKLFKSNVVTKQRLMDVETTLAELSEKRAGAKVQLARAVAEEIQLIRQKIELEEVFRARMSEEMAETWAKVEELQLELDKAGSASPTVSREKVSLSPIAMFTRTSQQANENGVAYMIIRRQGNAEVRLPAREVDALRPGDMIVVARTGGGEAGVTSARRTCGGSGPGSPRG
jgi:protein involved in polysaccharide export with SLBB domain